MTSETGHYYNGQNDDRCRRGGGDGQDPIVGGPEHRHEADHRGNEDEQRSDAPRTDRWQTLILMAAERQRLTSEYQHDDDHQDRHSGRNALHRWVVARYQRFGRPQQESPDQREPERLKRTNQRGSKRRDHQHRQCDGSQDDERCNEDSGNASERAAQGPGEQGHGVR